MPTIHVGPSETHTTIAAALASLPSVLTEDAVIELAAGTYAEPIVLTHHVGRVRIVGDVSTPANVTLTGSTTQPYRHMSLTSVVHVSGPAVLALEGIRLSATVSHAIYAARGAHVVIDRSAIAGSTSVGAFADAATLEFKGNCSVTGWTTYGIDATRGSSVLYTSPGTLTITGPGLTGAGVHLTGAHWLMFGSSGSGLHLTITNVLRGFEMGFGAHFQHQAPSSVITLSNSSAPSNSAAIYATDQSNWSTTQALTLNRFTVGFYLRALAFAEQQGGARTFTNLGSTSNVAQHSVMDLP